MAAPILNLCARSKAHTLQRSELVRACNDFSQWDDLLIQAEQHGMGPLLSLHLTTVDVQVPDPFLRGLRFLCLRHQQANGLRMKSLHSVLSLLEEEGVPVLVLKGAALCRTLYPAAGLRPMRDIDLLLAKEDVQHAHAFLQEEGFRIASTALPEDYYHLPPLVQDVDGMQLCIELHHGLFPDDPPYYQELPFRELYQNAFAFELDGVQAYTLATEEMLWHLYQHGFHAPLPFEPYKLISVADIVSLVEEKVAEIDWEKIAAVYPQLLRVLPLFHHLTPWNGTVVEEIPIETGTAPSGAGQSFVGWPRVKFAQRGNKGMLDIFRSTFMPSRWWLMLYYSIGPGVLAFLWCSFVTHPIHLLRWVKIYGNIFMKEKIGSVYSTVKSCLFR